MLMNIELHPPEVPMRKTRQNSRSRRGTSDASSAAGLVAGAEHDPVALRAALTVIVGVLRRASKVQVQDFGRLLLTLPDSRDEDPPSFIGVLVEMLSAQSQEELFDPEDSVTAAGRRKLLLYQKGVGRAIRDRRVELSLTQAELADMAGIPQSHISRLENGQHLPSYLTMESLARALKTDRTKFDPGLDE